MKSSTLLLSALFAAATTIGLAGTAQENWTSHCAKCHGADGSGKTTIGKKLKLSDFTTAEAQADFTDEKAVDVITNGIVENGKTKKNPFKEKLTAEEILDLVKLVRSYGPQPTAAATSDSVVASADSDSCSCCADQKGD